MPQRGELLQHLEIRGRAGLGLLEHRQLELLEQDVTQLRGRIDVEVRAGGAIEDLLQLPQHVATEKDRLTLLAQVPQ